MSPLSAAKSTAGTTPSAARDGPADATPHTLRSRVVVLTGASSGIGRATSLALAARNREALQSLAEECEVAGARALAVPTDVTGRDVGTRRIGQVFGMPNVNEPERRMLDFHHWLTRHTKKLHRASRMQ